MVNPNLSTLTSQSEKQAWAAIYKEVSLASRDYKRGGQGFGVIGGKELGVQLMNSLPP